MSRDIQAELKQLHEVNPNVGVVYNGKTALEWYTLYCQESWLVSKRHAPFEPGTQVKALRTSPQRYFDGDVNENCSCMPRVTYTVQGCVWGWKVGWLVSISNELHRASDFEVSAATTEHTKESE